MIARKESHATVSETRLSHRRRRKHRHWRVTIYYHDGQKFARVYIDRKRAEKFAERQKKSPIVRAVRIREVHQREFGLPRAV